MIVHIFKNNFEIQKDRKWVFTLGVFDGVHSGHQYVIDFLKNLAETENSETALMTFDPHPRFVLQPDTDFKLLTTLEEKILLLEQFGVQNIIIQEFSKDFSRLSALEFVRDILVKKFQIHSLIIGYDQKFGKNRDGNFEHLQNLAKTFHFDLLRLPSVNKNETTVSSTKIRNLLEKGEIEQANQYLGYEFIMTGTVAHGDRIGRTIGFPTANLEIDPQKICPKNGVYIVKVSIDNEVFTGMMNIGMRPTFGGGLKRQLEVHILNFNRNIYGKKIPIHFLDRIRDEKKFATKNELIKQLEEDKKKTEKFFL
ncbi:MAG: bifunctional riboflavin kinase/FAD synthetase [Flavobacteriaceae bacterium]|nr:bifunctional riboflavin kinase/FAD synthetase [Flavobacteriaceae bacterium]